jgi:hypothetical protein
MNAPETPMRIDYIEIRSTAHAHCAGRFTRNHSAHQIAFLWALSLPNLWHRGQSVTPFSGTNASSG